MIAIAGIIGKVMTFVSVLLMLILAFPIAFEAVLRAFGHPTIWVFEITLYALILLGFLGNALAIKSGAHFRITLLVDLFPKYRKMFDLLAHFSVLVFSILIMTAGIYFVWYSFSNSIVSATLLEIPLWIPQLSIPLGGLGLFLQTIILIAQPEDKIIPSSNGG